MSETLYRIYDDALRFIGYRKTKVVDGIRYFNSGFIKRYGWWIILKDGTDITSREWTQKEAISTATSVKQAMAMHGMIEEES